MANSSKDKQEKTFKVSDLKQITNLDNEDLFLMSDKEHGKYYTKNLTFKKLVDVIASNEALAKAIVSRVTEIDGGNASK